MDIVWDGVGVEVFVGVAERKFVGKDAGYNSAVPG